MNGKSDGLIPTVPILFVLLSIIVKISYTPDSKGYYRPVYEFVANANQDTGKREISIMVDAMEI